MWNVMPKPSAGCVLAREFQDFTLPPPPTLKRKMTRAEVRRKAAKAKKPRVTKDSFPRGWDKKRVVDTYKSSDTVSKEDWILAWNEKKNELQLTKDKVNRWAREIAQGRKSNAQ